jgi:hypothetical protein
MPGCSTIEFFKKYFFSGEHFVIMPKGLNFAFDCVSGLGWHEGIAILLKGKIQDIVRAQNGSLGGYDGRDIAKF